MIDYKRMYTLLCVAASDSLDILETSNDEQALLSVRFLLQQAMMRAEYIYTATASGNYPVEVDNE